MSKPVVTALFGLTVLASVLALRFTPSRKQDAFVTETAVRGPFTVWSDYDGVIESANVHAIMSQLDGAATIVELLPDGARVSAGDVVVRFDATQWERDLVRLERDYALAKTDLDTLVNARIPLELRDLEARLAEAQRNLEEERAALEADRELLAERLIPERDVRQQELRVLAVLGRVEALEQQLDLTRRLLHPAAVERARTTLTSAEQELALAKRRFANCTICAPVDGVIVYKPIAVGGEFRTVRVGDVVFRNQAFVVIPDMSNLVARCEVPEAELMRVRQGLEAIIFPLAYPEMPLEGVVQSVGSMAQPLPGRGESRKYFSVVVQIRNPPMLLRCGMTVRLRIRSYFNSNAILIPRSVVLWESNRAFCRVLHVRGPRKVPIIIGWGNETHYEVLEGLEDGARVLAP